MPEKTVKTAVARRQQGVVSDLKDFIAGCAQVRKQFDPENIKANVGRALGEFADGMDEDSKRLVGDVIGIFRGRR